MRFKTTAALMLALCGAAPALAQQVTQPNQIYVPMYNTSSTAPMYYQQTPNGTAPVYNNTLNTPTLPMNQMIAGKNAPSYQPRGNMPYQFNNNGGNWYRGQGAMSPQQEAALQQQIQANQQLAAQQAAQAQQQQYLNSLQQQQTVQQIQQYSQNGMPNLNMLQGGYGNQPQVPAKRRVVYKELNNPLREPQRLFNPDQ